MAIQADERLRNLLPSLDSPYDFDGLSEAETKALEAALGDGFGDNVAGFEASPLPKGVNSGLLAHVFFVRTGSEYDVDEFQDAFWESPNPEEGAPAPCETLPLGFVPRRLEIYFKNQLDRFSTRMSRERNRNLPLTAWQTEILANRRVYEKPWYEFRALELMQFCAMTKEYLAKGETAGLHLMFYASCFGRLGRLAEQYYWRFRYERATLTGVAARRGASAGGKAKAESLRTEHLRWKQTASKIWSRRPDLTKSAVAELIRRQLGVARTAKHIARVIVRH